MKIETIPQDEFDAGDLARSEPFLQPRPAIRMSRLPWLDGMMLVLAGFLAEVGAARADVPRAPLWVLVVFIVTVLVIFALRGLHRPRLSGVVLDDLRAIATTTALAAMILLAARSLLTSDVAVAPQGTRLWAFSVVFLATGRTVMHWNRQRARRSGRGLKPTLIIGAGYIGHLLATRLLERPELGLRPIGFLDKEPLGGFLPDVPVLGASWDLERVVAEHDVKHVIVSFSTAPMQVLLGLLERAERLGLETSFVPRLYERTTARLSIEHIGGLPLVSTRRVDPYGWHFAVKHGFDRVAAVLLVIVVAPLLVTSALAVWLDVGRPILFRQQRVGRDGKRFDILKYRSMREGAVADQPELEMLFTSHLAPGGVEGGDRRTRVGTFLRRTSMDELPQLFNVLRGDMSLVGPRPERPEFASRFAVNVRRYDERHRVKSGITGWAQVHGLRGKTSIANRAEWDNYYIENFSLWLDFKILLLTIAIVLRPSVYVE